MKSRLKISGNACVQQARRTCKTLALDESRNKDPIRFSPAYADKRTNVLAKYIHSPIDIFAYNLLSAGKC